MRIYKAGKKFGVDFTWHGGRVRLVGYTTRRATEALGRKLEALAACRESGERPDSELRAWLEGLPVNIKEKLAKNGLIDRQKIEAAKLLTEHIEDYRGVMEAKGGSKRHVQQEINKLIRVSDSCELSKITDISAEIIYKYLIGRLEGGVSPRTVNSELVAFKAFIHWLEKLGRISADPLKSLLKFNESNDTRRKRRALSDLEFSRLIVATENGGFFRKMPGEHWALFFQLAAETGFRWGELRSLTRAHFSGLDTENPSVYLNKEDTKNGKSYVQPLRCDLAVLLLEHLRNKLPAAPAFSLPIKDCGAVVIRHYLELTGDQEQGIAPIPYIDEAGRVFDFHALRGQFATNLARSGVSLAAARELMRRSTVNLTAKHYTHFGLEDRRAAIEKLPEIANADKNTVAKTGTCDVGEVVGEKKSFCRISAKLCGFTS